MNTKEEDFTRGIEFVENKLTVFELTSGAIKLSVDDIIIILRKMSDFFYHDNITVIFKKSIHLVLKCVEIEVPVWTGSKGHIMSFESHVRVY